MTDARFDGLDEFADGLLAAMRSQKVLNLLGLGAERIIQARTRRGVAVDGSAFEPYSEGYAKRREAAGLPTDRVNLQRSLYDGMLSKLDHAVARDLSAVDVLITDPRKAEIARYHTVPGAGRVYRPFLDLSDAETEQLATLAAGLIEGEIDDLLSVPTDPTARPRDSRGRFL